MPNVGHTWEFEDQTFFKHLPPDLVLEVWVENITFSQYIPESWHGPAEGGDLESYEIGDIYAYDGDLLIPLTFDQEKAIVDWAMGREDLEKAIYNADYSD